MPPPNEPRSRLEQDAFSAFDAGEAAATFFLEDRLRPILEPTDPAAAPPTPLQTKPDFISAQLLEAYSWLQFGVDIRYFSLEFSRRFFYEFAPRFLKAYADAKASKKTFDLWFPSNLRIMWEAEFLGRVPLFSFARVWNQDEPSEKLSAAFQSMFIVANDCAQNPQVTALVYSMLAATDTEWSEAVTKNRSIFGLQEVGAGLGESHWTYPGVVGLIEYMRAFRQLKEDVQTSLADLKPDPQRYLDRFREIQQWRLNFGYPRYRTRFMEVAKMAAAKLIPQQNEQSVITALKVLLADWGAPIEAVRTA